MAIYYNSVILPNASITSINKTAGAFTWQFKCHTSDKSQITALESYAAPLTTGISITGLQYVISGKAAQTLVIDTDSYTNCYIQGPIQTTPMIISKGKEEYIFTVTVVQSAI